MSYFDSFCYRDVALGSSRMESALSCPLWHRGAGGFLSVSPVKHSLEDWHGFFPPQPHQGRSAGDKGCPFPTLVYFVVSRVAGLSQGVAQMFLKAALCHPVPLGFLQSDKWPGVMGLFPGMLGWVAGCHIMELAVAAAGRHSWSVSQLAPVADKAPPLGSGQLLHSSPSSAPAPCCSCPQCKKAGRGGFSLPAAPELSQWGCLCCAGVRNAAGLQ